MIFKIYEYLAYPDKQSRTLRHLFRTVDSLLEGMQWTIEDFEKAIDGENIDEKYWMDVIRDKNEYISVVEKLSTPEIADTMKTSRSAIDNMLYRSLRKIKHIDPEFDKKIFKLNAYRKNIVRFDKVKVRVKISINQNAA